MDRVEAVDLMENRRQAWVSKDVDTYLSLFADDFVYSDGVEHCSGRASWEEVVRRNYERFSPVSWEIHEMAVDGSNILAEWTATIVPTGMEASVSARGMSISETRNGLFTSHREYLWRTG
jgi:hypothetical protein